MKKCIKKRVRKRVNKLIAILCAFVIVVPFFLNSLTPVSAAMDAPALAAHINNIAGLSALQSGSDVIVTSVSTVSFAATLSLNIDSGVTVKWQANITSPLNAYLFDISGGGEFEVSNCSILSTGTRTSGAIRVSGAATITIGSSGSVIAERIGNPMLINAGGVTINVEAGGVVRSLSNNSNAAIQISGNTQAAVQEVTINVNGGSVISDTNGNAINDGAGTSPIDGNKTIITVSGGVVTAGGNSAIHATGTHSTVTVTGGVVSNAAGNNFNPSIDMIGDLFGASGPNVTVSGAGVVQSTSVNGYTIQTRGNVLVEGSALVSAINGRAINLVGMSSVATVTGGIVETVNGTAVSTATTNPEQVENASITISGGIVQATGTGTAVRVTGKNGNVSITGGDVKAMGTGIVVQASGENNTVSISGGKVQAEGTGTSVRVSGALSTVDISGGWVTAKNGYAVDVSGALSAEISNGFVFAWGNSTSKVVTPITKLDLTFVGMIVAWNTTDGTGTYYEDSSTDLTIMPAETATAEWKEGSPANGIEYLQGGNSGFFPLDVTITIQTYSLTIVNRLSTTVLGPYKAGTVVSISADLDYVPSLPVYSPYPLGSAFSGWTEESGTGGEFEDASSRDTTYVMPSGDAVVTANYVDTYCFFISGASIARAYRNTGSPLSPNTGFYPEGTVIVIERTSSSWVVAGVTYYFDHWIDRDEPGSEAFGNIEDLVTTFTMPGRDVRVEYVSNQVSGPPAPVSRAVNVIAGLITGTTGGAAIIPVTSYSAMPGTGLIITADLPPSAEHEFDSWEIVSGSGRFTDAGMEDTTFTMLDSDATIRATYKLKTYSLTVEGGTGDGQYAADEPVSISAVPPSDMEFAGWTFVNGGGSFGDQFAETTTFTMPGNDAVIEAIFEYSNHSLEVIDGIDDTGLHDHHRGEVVTIIAVAPLQGMVFNGWSSNRGGTFDNAGSETTTFTMPDENVTVTAHFTTTGTNIDDPEDTPPYIPPRPVKEPAKEEGTDIGARNETGGAAEAVFPFIKEHIAYVSGYPDVTVRPEQDITRAEVAVIFYRLLINELHESIQLQENPFSDVRTGNWYNTAVSAMSELGIVNGYPDGTFRPDAVITRAELATIAAHFASMMKMESINEVGFNDITGHWAAKDIIYTAEIGWTTGYADGTFRPAQKITRAEFITLVNRVLERVPETVDDLMEEGMIRWIDNDDPDAWYYIAVQEATNSHVAEYKEKTVPGLQFKYEYWVEMAG